MFAYPAWEGTAKKAIPATSAPAPDISLKPTKRDLRFMAGKAPLLGTRIVADGAAQAPHAPSYRET